MGGPPQDDEQMEMLEELQSRLTMALSLLQSLEPTGVGARNLAECLTLQIKALTDDEASQAVRDVALDLCKQPLEWIAKRDLKRLTQAVGGSEADLKSALTLLTRLEPKPGRRFVQVERHIIIPDVLVIRI